MAFSKIMKKCVKAIREIWNIKATINMDDLVLLHPNHDHFKKMDQEVKLFLKWLGWTVNEQKNQYISSIIWDCHGTQT
jgi:uncharacterized protein YsxB (DUF464 family)